MVAIGGIADIVQHLHEMARSRMTLFDTFLESPIMALRSGQSVGYAPSVTAVSANLFLVTASCQIALPHCGPTKFFCLDSADDYLNRTDLTYLALQHGATQLKTLAYEINVGLEFKKQVRMPYRHAQIVCRLFNSIQIGLKYIEL
jgi:hypothetical protein